MTRPCCHWRVMRPVCGIWPTMERTSEVLPPPLAPTMQWMVPARTVKFTPSRMVVLPSASPTSANSIEGPCMSVNRDSGALAGVVDDLRQRIQVLAHLIDELAGRIWAAADVRDGVHAHSRGLADGVRQLAGEILLGEQHVDLRRLDAIDGLGQLSCRRLHAMARLDHCRDLQPKLLQDVIVAAVHGGAAELRQIRAGDLGVEL